MSTRTWFDHSLALNFVGRIFAAGYYTRSIPNVAHAYRHAPLDTQRTVAAAEDTVVLTNVTQQDQNWSSLGWSESIRKVFAAGYRNCPDYGDRFKYPEEPFVKRNGLLFHKSQTMMTLCVPYTRDNRLQTSIISCFHASNIAANPGAHRTYLRIAQWYHWPTLDQDVREYVQSCETCARWKHSNARKNDKMIPIPIPDEYWSVVFMDFITGLPVSNSFDAIMTVVDKLSKRPKYRACHRTDDAQKTAYHFFDCVARHHCLPSIMISDRDPKFVSKFWSSLAKLMGIRLHMTTSYRAQADGQTERHNLILEDALRCMVSYHGRDWSDHLGTIEYAHSTLVSASTGLTPFEVDTGRKERNPLNPLANPSIMRQVQHGIAEYAKQFQDRRQEIVDVAKKHLLQAQERQKKYYDKKRSSITFKEGTLVVLDTRRIPSAHVTQDIGGKRAKLAARKVGPFEIVKMINPNVARLKRPRSMSRLNSTFNVDVLTHYVENPSRFKSRPIPKASRLIIDEDTGDTMYIIEKLLRKRQFNRKPEWLVKWHGLPDHEATWEREKDIHHVSHWKVLVDDFKKRQREVKSGRM